MIELLKFLFIIICLIYASYTDLKQRKVPNYLWLFMFPFAIISFIYTLFQFNSITILLACSISIAFALVCWYANGFGGADAKAIIILSLFYPYFYLNVPYVMWVVLIAGILSLIYSLLNKLKLRSEQVFIPFITIAFVIVFI